MKGYVRGRNGGEKESKIRKRTVKSDVSMENGREVGRVEGRQGELREREGGRLGYLARPNKQ